MAKRFIDTDMWSKKWIRLLNPELKLFWVYLLSRCNHAGIYEVDLELASFQLKIDLDQKTIMESFNGNIKPIEKDKWFIPKFVEFQYGPLNEKVNAHKSVINILNKYKLINKNQQLINSSSTVQDKDKDIDKVTDKDNFESWWKLYDLKVGKQNTMMQWIKKAITDDEYQDIINHTKEYVKGDKKYRKHPERYIRDRKWEDEIVVATQKINLKDYRMTTTGHYIGYCQKCSESSFYKANDLNNDSTCCNADITANKESK